MIKRILVALDTDEDTSLATDYAVWLGKQFESELTGLALVNLDAINANYGAGAAIGAVYYEVSIVDQMTKTSRREARRLLESFREKVLDAGLRHTEEIREGVPFQRIIEDMKIHDLLVIGRDSHFFYNKPDESTHTLDQVVKEGICPVLVIPQESPEPGNDVEKIVLTYDGSPAAARTMQWFGLLKPFGDEMDVDIVHVREGESDDNKRKSNLMTDLAASYLRSHGFASLKKISLHKGNAGEQLMEYIDIQEPDFVIAGAHSVSALRRMTFGSTTHTLVNNSEVPLFLSH